MWESIKDSLNEWIFGIFEKLVTSELNLLTEMFTKSVENVQGNVIETPMEFSPTLLSTLENVSNSAMLPVAGLILTYIFCYELVQMVMDKNRGNDFDTGQLLFLIIKTSVVIILVTNSFKISLAFFDLGSWITNKIPDSALLLPESIKVDLLKGIENGDIGQAILMTIVTTIGLIFVLVMTGIIYLVAWSRIITIMLYISVSPIAFATFMNKDWIGSIGQNYIKNLMALMLQGFFMIMCLVIYGALLEKVSGLIANESSAIFGLILMIVSMGVLVLMLTKTHGLAKSVMGAS